MSYKFDGRFELNQRLDEATYEFLKDLNSTRRMKRSVDNSFGVDGEFYVNGNEYDSNITDRNKSPKTQPSIFCPWTPSKDRLAIQWDGKEKASCPVEWIEYIVSKVLSPRDFILNGEVEFWDDDFYRRKTDMIEVVENNVNGKRPITNYAINKLLPLRGKANTASLPNIRQIGSSKSAASATAKPRRQTAKEKRDEITRQLEAQVLVLQDQLLEKDKEIKRAGAVAVAPPKKKVTVQDVMLEKIKVDTQFGGSLDDFKLFLKNLLA